MYSRINEARPERMSEREIEPEGRKSAKLEKIKDAVTEAIGGITFGLRVEFRRDSS